MNPKDPLQIIGNPKESFKESNKDPSGPKRSLKIPFYPRLWEGVDEKNPKQIRSIRRKSLGGIRWHSANENNKKINKTILADEKKKKISTGENPNKKILENPEESLSIGEDIHVVDCGTEERRRKGK